MNNWCRIPFEEQETIINFDYYNKWVEIYTSRRIVATKITKKIGDPQEKTQEKGKICGVTWKIIFGDRKRIRSALVITNLLMNKQLK